MMGEVNDNATGEKHKTNQINIIIHKKKDIQKLSVVPQDSKNLTEKKKTAAKTSNKFKIVPRIMTCDAGFSSSKFPDDSPVPFIVKQTTPPVFS
jgi:hypothetical protein